MFTLIPSINNYYHIFPDYSNYIDRKKHEFKREQELARNFTNEFVREIEASCERRITSR